MNKSMGIPGWMALLRAPGLGATKGSQPLAGAAVGEGDRFDELIRELFVPPGGASLPPESVPVPEEVANDLDAPLPDPMSAAAWRVPDNVVPLAPVDADLSAGFPPPLRPSRDEPGRHEATALASEVSADREGPEATSEASRGLWLAPPSTLGGMIPALLPPGRVDPAPVTPAPSMGRTPASPREEVFRDHGLALGATVGEGSLLTTLPEPEPRDLDRTPLPSQRVVGAAPAAPRPSNRPPLEVVMGPDRGLGLAELPASSEGAGEAVAPPALDAQASAANRRPVDAGASGEGPARWSHEAARASSAPWGAELGDAGQLGVASDGRLGDGGEGSAASDGRLGDGGEGLGRRDAGAPDEDPGEASADRDLGFRVVSRARPEGHYGVHRSAHHTAPASIPPPSLPAAPAPVEGEGPGRIDLGALHREAVQALGGEGEAIRVRVDDDVSVDVRVDGEAVHVVVESAASASAAFDGLQGELADQLAPSGHDLSSYHHRTRDEAGDDRPSAGRGGRGDGGTAEGDGSATAPVARGKLVNRIA